MTRIILSFILFLILLGASYIYNSTPKDQFIVETPNTEYKNISYLIENEYIIPTYFGNEVRGDFNNDGKEDVAFIVTNSPGGSGTFYYAVVAIKTDTSYMGTNGIFLGDRIAPQSTEVKGNQIIVNYADRKLNEPMTAQPSVGVSKYLSVKDGKLVETKK